MKRLLPIVAVAALTAVCVASALAAKVSWTEYAKNGKARVMLFHVDSLSFGKKAWSAHVTFKNLSKNTIKIGDNFGSAIFDDGSTEDLHEAVGYAVAQNFSPARPKVLKPGASWTGTIGGLGNLAASSTTRYARIVFGKLTGMPGQTHAVIWITDHSLVLPGAASGSGTTII